jgi:hypothetical protein
MMVTGASLEVRKGPNLLSKGLSETRIGLSQLIWGVIPRGAERAAGKCDCEWFLQFGRVPDPVLCGKGGTTLAVLGRD